MFIVETGVGLSNSNSYISVEDADTFFATRLRSTAWTGADSTTKQAALVMATLAIDANFHFKGFQVNGAQKLQWPRGLVVNRNRYTGYQPYPFNLLNRYFDQTSIPDVVKQAVCELALVLITDDRTENPPGEGLRSFEIAGVIKASFDAASRKPFVPEFVKNILDIVTETYLGGAGAVQLLRR